RADVRLDAAHVVAAKQTLDGVTEGQRAAGAARALRGSRLDFAIGQRGAADLGAGDVSGARLHQRRRAHLALRGGRRRGRPFATRIPCWLPVVPHSDILSRCYGSRVRVNRLLVPLALSVVVGGTARADAPASGANARLADCKGLPAGVRGEDV